MSTGEERLIVKQRLFLLANESGRFVIMLDCSSVFSSLCVMHKNEEGGGDLTIRKNTWVNSETSAYTRDAVTQS